MKEHSDTKSNNKVQNRSVVVAAATAASTFHVYLPSNLDFSFNSYEQQERKNDCERVILLGWRCSELCKYAMIYFFFNYVS